MQGLCQISALSIEIVVVREIAYMKVIAMIAVIMEVGCNIAKPSAVINVCQN